MLDFPIYRTYVTSAGPAAHDRALISQTIERARAEWFAADDGIFEFLRDTLTMDLIKPGRPAHSAPRVRRFALKVQQFTGPLMAKALEDTAFYRYHRLLALNEVGGDPSAKALSIDAFHEAMKIRAKQWPHGMTATATHDTKRGEDARARLLALAEVPGEWASAVSRWKILNAPHLLIEGEMRAPSATFEYMLYQALLGAWPSGEGDDSFRERMQAYALKAAREGKQETSWLNPHPAYEAGLRTFIERILDRSISAEFLSSLDTLARRVSLLGALNSLSQITLKATIPGVPDFYQGTELWDFSLVDPDNRRPVDYSTRRKLLAEQLEHVAGAYSSRSRFLSELALDPPTSGKICDLIIELRDLEKVSSIVVTHEMDVVKYLTSKYVDVDEKGKLRFKEDSETLCLTNTNILMLRKGREIFSGTGKELIESKDPYIHDFILGTEMLPELTDQRSG